MIPDGIVYRAGRGQRWHWRINGSFGAVSACSAWPLTLATAAPAVAVDIPDRCSQKGCAARWNTWLADTVRACLVEDLHRAGAA